MGKSRTSFEAGTPNVPETVHVPKRFGGLHKS